MWEIVQRAIGSQVARLDFLESVLEGALRGNLHVEIQRGIDAIAPREQVVTKPGIQLHPGPLDEVLRHAEEVLSRTHSHGIGFPPLCFVRSEKPLIAHLVEDRIA